MLRETVKVAVATDLSKMIECLKNGYKTNMTHVSLLLPTNLVTFYLPFIGKTSVFLYKYRENRVQDVKGEVERTLHTQVRFIPTYCTLCHVQVTATSFG